MLIDLRFRQRRKEYGLAISSQLLVRELWSRVRVSLGNRCLTARHACPCCDWEGHSFEDYFEVIRTHRNVECPRCGSHPRHRALFLWLQREYKLKDKRGVGLLLGPERSLAEIWASAVHLRAIRVDLKPRRDVDLRADLRCLPIASDSVDFQWCHHVLEHIQDDRAAIKELFRVLRPVTGELIVSVPMVAGTVTREYGFANNRESGHWRIYGDDFAARLTDGGFAVEAIVQSLSPSDYERYGLIHEQYYLCWKPGMQGTGTGL
jgi:SAM-dependent methyltransferase